MIPFTLHEDLLYVEFDYVINALEHLKRDILYDY